METLIVAHNMKDTIPKTPLISDLFSEIILCIVYLAYTVIPMENIVRLQLFDNGSNWRYGKTPGDDRKGLYPFTQVFFVDLFLLDYNQ
jgi:hypothetical protein